MRRTALVLAAIAWLPLSGGAKARAPGPWRLRMPTELAKTEQVVTEGSGYEGQKCLAALAYRQGPTAIFSMDRASLKGSGKLATIERVLALGNTTDANALKLTSLLCSDANVGAGLALGSAKSAL